MSGHVALAMYCSSPSSLVNKLLLLLLVPSGFSMSMMFRSNGVLMEFEPLSPSLCKIDSMYCLDKMVIKSGVWITFEQDFKDFFTNTNRKNKAFNELTALKQKENLNIFISEFKQLATSAGIMLNDHRTIYLFKKGLKPALVQAIIAFQGYDPQNPWPTFKLWEDAAQACYLKWLHSQEFRKQNDARYEGLYKDLNIAPQNRRGPLHLYNQGNCRYQSNCRYQANRRGQQNHGNRGCLTTSQGGDYMDVNAIQGPDLLDTQKSEYMAANKCFYCTIPGHRTKDCHKKQVDQTQDNGRAAATNTGVAKPPNITTFNMSPDDIANFLKDNVDTIDPDTKLSIIEKILPTGFLMGPN